MRCWLSSLLQDSAAKKTALIAQWAFQAWNVQAKGVTKDEKRRTSKHSIARRMANSHVLARAVGLDLVGAGWRPTVEGYFGRVTKPRILADVAEAKGSKFAEMIDHLKTGDMANEA